MTQTTYSDIASNNENANSIQGHHTLNPFTEEEIDFYPYDSLDEITQKLNKSDLAFHVWKKKTLEERKTPIKKFGELLKENKEEMSKLMVKEMGKTLVQAKAEVDRCCKIINHSVENCEKYLADKHEKLSQGDAVITYSPQGVILSIQPWNFPLYQAIRHAIPSILAGNTTLLKHAQNVWGCAQKIEQLFKEAGLDEGVFCVLYAQEKDLEKIYESRKIRGVTFTGSPNAGKEIGALAAKNLKKSVLELGGSDAYLVLEDADLDLAVKHCTQGRLNNNGQTCICAKRFIVVESVYEEFKKKFVKSMSEAQMGDPMDKTTHVGPLARKDLLEKLNEQVDKSIEKGAKCLVGGNIEKRKGFFFQPTILENLAPGMPAYDEELFGPVASLIKVKDIQEAIEVSNSSKFGLGGGIFGQDEDKLLKVAKEELDTGMVNINGFGAAEANLPFGGVKESGYGREFSHYGFHEFMNIKTVMIRRNKDGQ